jgi:methionyl-tRNA formyltransferase
MISALRMVKELDAGPIYLKRRLCLKGLGEEIFIRASNIIAEMILEIITKEPYPEKQVGNPTVFKRRTPKQSEISAKSKTLKELFDHIRMLDASEYPRAFIRCGNFKFEISKPALRTGAIEADIRIVEIKKGE